MTPPPPAASAAARTAPAIHPRRAPAAPTRRPRRVSGPVKSRPAPVPARHAARARNPATIVTTHPLFDRLIHGRAWIGLVAFALIGIVTMQLGLLKLNAGIGRALEHEGALQRENAALSVENSEVAAGDTVELQAAHMGMRLVPAGSLRFLSAQGSQSAIGRALAALNARASATATGSTSSEASSAPQSEASATTSTATSEASSTSTAGGEAGSEHTTSPEASRSSTSSSGEAPATSSASAPASAESGASAAAPSPAPSPAPSGESGGASATPGG